MRCTANPTSWNKFYKLTSKRTLKPFPLYKSNFVIENAKTKVTARLKHKNSKDSSLEKTPFAFVFLHSVRVFRVSFLFPLNTHLPLATCCTPPRPKRRVFETALWLYPTVPHNIAVPFRRIANSKDIDIIVLHGTVFRSFVFGF